LSKRQKAAGKGSCSCGLQCATSADVIMTLKPLGTMSRGYACTATCILPLCHSSCGYSGACCCYSCVFEEADVDPSNDLGMTGALT